MKQNEALAAEFVRRKFCDPFESRLEIALQFLV